MEHCRLKELMSTIIHKILGTNFSALREKLTTVFQEFFASINKIFGRETGHLGYHSMKF